MAHADKMFEDAEAMFDDASKLFTLGPGTWKVSSSSTVKVEPGKTETVSMADLMKPPEPPAASEVDEHFLSDLKDL